MGLFKKKTETDGKKPKKEDTIFTKETLGVVLILFATLCLVCLITRDAVFSGVGIAVNTFLFGTFGYFAYVAMGMAIYYGIVCITGKRLHLSKKLTAFIVLSAVCLALLLHVITTFGFSGSYGEYISSSYLMASVGGITTCSGGGFITALVAYVFPTVLQGSVPAIIVLSILFAICVFLVVRTVMKQRKGEVVVDVKEGLRTSFVKTEEVIPSANVELSGVKDYPVQEAVPNEVQGKQKLFVVDPKKDDFKAIKLKSEQQPVKIDYTNGGLGVASATVSYSQAYAGDIQSKLDYIKTPAPIEVDKHTYYNTGSYSSNTQEQTTKVSDYISPNPTVSDYISPNPTYSPMENSEPKVEETVEQPKTQQEQTQNPIPFFEHQETVYKDDAQSHADRFASLADFEDTQNSNLTVEPVEIVRPVVEPKPLETPEEDKPITRQEFTHTVEIEEIFDNEEKTAEVSEPPISTVRSERVRNIFVAPEETEENVTQEPTSYTSRVVADNNQDATAGRMGFGRVIEPPVEEPVAEEKPPKPAPPINREYFRPPLDLLQKYEQSVDAPQEDHPENMEIIKQTLAQFHINAEPQGYVQGPSITRYEIMMPAGVSVRRVLSYDDDLRMRLASREGVRIEAPIPGKNLVGIEVANKVPQTVGLREVMELSAKDGKSKPGSLMFALGKDIVGNAITDNLAKGPHYLVAGATGSGKSVCLNTMIVSLIMRYSPEELRLFLVDPKGVEFAAYEHLPHLMIDEIITSPQKAIEMLKWAYTEMERRFSVFRESNQGIVNIDDYNQMVASDTVAKMPRIVIIIDELADLMQTAKKDLEARICAIAQKARSAGIHLVLATQRPSVDVITGTIKANLPSRIAFKVMNFNDSQTILSEAGAEKLLGNGDMLYKNSQMPGVARYQGAYIHMREVNNVVNYIKEKNVAYFDDELQEFLEKAANPQPEAPVSSENAGADGGENSDIFLRALWFGVNAGTISISAMQRRFGIGFSKAGGIMDKMDRMGLVSQNEGSKARRVLLTREEYEQRFGQAPPDEF